MPEVVMPRLSDSMEEGTILKWLKPEGAEVKRGEEIVEIETDKATMSYEADADGALHIVAAEGDTLPIGALIATIGEAAPAATEPATPAAPAHSGNGDSPNAAPSPVAAAAEPVAAAAEPVAATAAPVAGTRAKASPLARRVAAERGIDLTALVGTGPGGRIVKADVEAAVTAPASPAVPQPAAPAPQAPASAPVPAPAPTLEPAIATAKGDVTIVELTRTQQLVARRMAESRATVPDFTLTVTIDMESCVAMREQLKVTASADSPVPSYNDMVVKACALALREMPLANGAYRDGHFELHSRVNVGIAVAAENSLVVPTIFDADRRSLGEIARDSRELAEKVRAGTITPPELSGATFTVSNLGMFGTTRFTAVINAPQAAILAVGALEPRPVVHDGNVVARHTLDATLSCDHRILYGADAARFGARIKELLEQPFSLAL
jgi:pyruvate dehydrogenase E2 component (dihydrolipoamide acetyltransferase)